MLRLVTADTGGTNTSPPRDRVLDDIAPRVMFGVTVAWLAVLAAELQHLRHPHLLFEGTTAFLWGLVALWPAYFVELGLHLAARSGAWRSHALACVFPPARLALRDRATGSSVWLPVLGWTKADRAGRDRVERVASGPMIGLALLVLPILLVEHAWADKVTANASLLLCLETATSLIWLGFTVEFIVMLAVVDKRVKYVREHWVDLAVILLPFVAFLRVLRLGQLARLARVYRLRGLATRTYRAMLVLNIVARFARVDPTRRLATLHEKLAEKEQELALIRDEIAGLERRRRAA